MPRKEAVLEVSPIIVTNIKVVDLRFPTSKESIGSDAVNKDPDYSAAYCILETNGGVEGHGLTFTLGRGTELCVAALQYLGRFVKGRSLDSLTSDMAAFCRELTDESQFRWLGPEKGVIHLATGALINAIWDLYAKAQGKPLWKLLASLEPEQILSAVEFRYIDDALSRGEAREILEEGKRGQAERIALLEREGYPAYTTSAGWFGFSDEKIRVLSRKALAEGWTHFKLKVGGDAADDLRRGRIVREEIGWTNRLAVDANQKWGVVEAIERTRALGELEPWWMEEPTSPDDILGHARIRREVAPIRIATGEHCHNRVMFKQLFQAQGDRCLPDRQLPRCGREREPGDHPDGGEVWRSGLSACWRRWAVRACAASLGVRLRVGLADDGEPRHRVRRSPARALRRSGADQPRTLSDA